MCECSDFLVLAGGVVLALGVETFLTGTKPHKSSQ